MSPSWAETCRVVRERAGDRCEYCRIHQALQGGTFHVEHIVPRCQDGLDSTDNLALSCPGCNLQKATRTSAPDPATGAGVPFFNPRTDSWPEHLAWEGYRIHGRTPKGRALVAALDLNHTRRLRIRLAEEHFRLFPP